MVVRVRECVSVGVSVSDVEKVVVKSIEKVRDD